MKREREGKEKYPLLFATIVAFLTVCTTGVSTFAWFQANAAVNIQSTTASTTITVSKPNDFVFYGYKGNTVTNWASQGSSFASDFEQIVASNLAQKTSFTGDKGEANKFNPGDVKCFALKFDHHVSTDELSLKIKKMVSNTINMQDSGKHRYDKTNLSAEINIGWAIDIYSLYTNDVTTDYAPYRLFAKSTHGSSVGAVAGTPLAANAAGDEGTTYYTRTPSKEGAGTLSDENYAYIEVNSIPATHPADTYFPLTSQGANGTDRFTINPGSETQIAYGENGLDENNVRTLSSAISVYPPNTSISDTVGYLFFSIVFNDTPTMRYAEVIGENSNEIRDEPSTNATKYYLKNTGASSDYKYNSNCFSGLEFALTEMEFKF